MKITALKFRKGGRTYYYNADEIDNIHIHDKVIAKTSRGEEFGTVSVVFDDTNGLIKKTPLSGLLRIATENDLELEKTNEHDENEAMKICREKIAEHGLPMKLVDAEYIFDRTKLVFYFSADGRVDFRSLVKDLAGIFHIRIDLRQIGVRDETRVLGGIGPCGRELCCREFITEFAPVSIKMAKEQNLSLNPTKISGVCGRLMCCLNNEAQTYEYLNRQMPRKGDLVKTRDSRSGEVVNVNILTQRVSVMFTDKDTREVEEFAVSDLLFDPKQHIKAKTVLKDPDTDDGNNKKNTEIPAEKIEEKNSRPKPRRKKEWKNDRKDGFKGDRKYNRNDSRNMKPYRKRDNDD
jgi:cell fate regulator YaaT (PSP1 superfamily)